MKKIIVIAIILSTVFLLNDSFKIATPEELLVSPALNEEKRIMKEAVDNFRPPNSIGYPVIMQGSDKSVSMIISDLDMDSSSEIISFYKSRVDDKIGMFILKKTDGMWIKRADIKFNTYEISEFIIDDLDADNNRELIVEAFEIENKFNPRNYTIISFEDKNVRVIDEIPNIVFKIDDIDQDASKEIFSVTRSSSAAELVLNVDTFAKHSINSYARKNLRDIKNPYNILIGNIYENQRAVFINYVGDNRYENTSILLFDQALRTFTDLNDIEEFKNSGYQFNIESKDIDKDGIIEVGYKFRAPNYTVPIYDTGEEALINGYFKIKDNYSLELVREIYEDRALGFSLDIPRIFTGKYTITKNKDDVTVVNFINYIGKEYPLVEIRYIKKYEWQQDATLRNSMQLISETQEYVVAGKVLDYSDNLQEGDRENYLQMRSAVQILSNIIKEILY